MKKGVRIIITLIMLTCMIFSNKIVYAALDKDGTGKEREVSPSITGKPETNKEESPEKISDILKQANGFLNKGKQAEESEDNTIDIDENELKKELARIFNMLSTIGMILSVVVGGVLGIKFMMASAEDKAQIKEMMTPYIVGCVVIFAAFAIWKLAVNMLANVF